MAACQRPHTEYCSRSQELPLKSSAGMPRSLAAMLVESGHGRVGILTTLGVILRGGKAKAPGLAFRYTELVGHARVGDSGARESSAGDFPVPSRQHAASVGMRDAALQGADAYL